jgi:hypothetical protein
MDWQAWLAIALTLGVLITLMVTRLGPHLVMMAALAILSVAGVLGADEVLAGFGNPGLITVAAMFVVAAGLEASGGIDLLVNHLLGRPTSVQRAQLRIATPVTILSAFLNNTPLVAAMIPALHAWSRKIGVAPSKLMIPLSYSAILGGTLTLIGTSTNLVVNGQYQALTGNPGFQLFDITPVGLPVAIVGVIFMLLAFPRLLLTARTAPPSPTYANSPSKSRWRPMVRWWARPWSRPGCAICAGSIWWKSSVTATSSPRFLHRKSCAAAIAWYSPAIPRRFPICCASTASCPRWRAKRRWPPSAPNAVWWKPWSPPTAMP